MAIIFCDKDASLTSREIILNIYHRWEEGKSKEWLWGYLEGVDDTEGQLEKEQYNIIADYIYELERG